MDNLFICFTPLHILISRSICVEKQIKDPYWVFLAEIKSKTNDHYFNEINKSGRAFQIRKRNNFLLDFIEIIRVMPKLPRNPESIFTGNIKSFHTRFLLFLLKPEFINTFDDGSGNISGAGYFYDINETFHSSVFFTLFNKRFLYKNITSLISQHYTIFKQDNVFKNAIKINIFSQSTHDNEQVKANSISILLGNAFSEDGLMKIQDENSILQKIQSIFDVDIVLKHPREKYSKNYPPNVTTINDVKISEEIIMDLSKTHDITVIGVFSTTLLNLSNIPGLNLINIIAPINKPVQNLIKIFEENNIKNIDLDKQY
jgi:hypothetical protein